MNFCQRKPLKPAEYKVLRVIDPVAVTVPVTVPVKVKVKVKSPRRCQYPCQSQRHE